MSFFIRKVLFTLILLFPLNLYASFIESTIGTAVVNDATASFYNPAALILLKNPQFIALGSYASFHSRFVGQAIQSRTGFMQSGSTSAQTNYFLPSIYLGIPVTNNAIAGLAIVSNFFSRDIEDNAILRYAQSNSHIENIDVVPAIGIKLNQNFSFGIGVNFSYAKFILRPILGFPSFGIPDTESRNEANGKGIGGEIGFLLKASPRTLIGFNYRSTISYTLNGTSIFEGNPEVVSNNYFFRYWTPARSVVSISHALTPRLGFISTVQWIEWSIFNEVNIHGIATQFNSQPLIIPNVTVPYHFHDAWIFTIGNQYRVIPQWIVRFAASYLQSPGNGNYQLTNGDNYILGASTSYEITKNFLIDGSYAHAFIKNQPIHIADARNIINGTNKGYRDSVSLKLTFNI